MSREEVVQRVGIPVYEEHGRLEFKLHDEFVEHTEVWIAENRVVHVGGLTLQFEGEELGGLWKPFEKVERVFGPHNGRHLYGSGGGEVRCWSSSDVVMETSVLEESLIGFIQIGDPCYFSNDRHLWYSSCGSLDSGYESPYE
jgi:hypothetical protein